MRPHLVEFLNRVLGTEVFTYLVPNYLLMTAFAVVACTLLGVRLAERRGLDSQVLYGMVLWSFPAGLLGARLFHVAYAADTYHGGPLRFLDPLQGSAVSYGGALGAVACAFLYLRRQRAPVGAYLDLTAPVIGFGIAASRLGCFLDGCDFGRRTMLPWAVRFPPESLASFEQARLGWLPHQGMASLPVHPVQLYLGASALILGWWILRWQNRHPEASPGRSFAIFWLLYALSRFGWEFLRGDSGRGFVGPLSTAQVVSIPTAALALLFLWRTRGPAEEHPQAEVSP